MTNSLISRAVVCAGIVALAISLAGQRVMADDDDDDRVKQVIITNPASNFVGLSGGELMGNAGLSLLFQACQSSHGARARMCTDAEIIHSPSIANPGLEPGEAAWVQPIPSAFGSRPDCNGWSASGLEAVILRLNADIRGPNTEWQGVSGVLELADSYVPGTPLTNGDFVSLSMTGDFRDDGAGKTYNPAGFSVPGDYDFVSISGTVAPQGEIEQNIDVRFSGGGSVVSNRELTQTEFSVFAPGIEIPFPNPPGQFDIDVASGGVSWRLDGVVTAKTGLTLLSLASRPNNPRSTSLQPSACNVARPVACCALVP